MSGCFGNSQEDKYRERELNRYLDALEADETALESRQRDFIASVLADDQAFEEHEHGYEFLKTHTDTVRKLLVSIERQSYSATIDLAKELHAAFIGDCNDIVRRGL